MNIKPNWTRLTRPSLRALVLTIAPVGHAIAQQSTWIVDPLGGGDFAQLQGALGVAANGDTIIVRDGMYALPPATVVDGKGLTIIGEEGAVPRISGTIEFRDTMEGFPTVLQNLVIESGPGIANGTLVFRDCEGPVWLDEVVVQSSPSAGPGILLIDVSAASLNFCEATGGVAESASSSRSPGLRVESSRAFLTSCTLAGGASPRGSSMIVDGDPGILVIESQVRFQGCMILGGDGADGVDTTSPGGGGGFPTGPPSPQTGCLDPGNGGDSILVQGSNNDIKFDQLTNGSFMPGTGGMAVPCSLAIASPGIGYNDQGVSTSGPATPLPARILSISTAAAVQQVPNQPTSIELTVTGNSGDYFVLRAGLAATTDDALLDASVFIAFPNVTYVQGVISGVTSENRITFELPAFPPGFGQFRVYGQMFGVSGPFPMQPGDPFPVVDFVGGTHHILVYE